MKAPSFSLTAQVAATLVLGIICAELCRADNRVYGVSAPAAPPFFVTITNIPGSKIISGQNPTLPLTAGATYRFIIGDPSLHPVVIATNIVSPIMTAAYSGATPQNIFN